MGIGFEDKVHLWCFGTEETNFGMIHYHHKPFDKKLWIDLHPIQCQQSAIMPTEKALFL